MKMPISFNFDFDKFLNLVVYLASKVDNFDVLKAMKLIYLIDRHHLVREGRPITGDLYYRLDLGPVPSISYDLIKQMDFDNPATDQGLPDTTKLLESLDIDRSLKYPIYRNKIDADLEYFSEIELTSIKSIISKFGQFDSISLMNLTHKHAAHIKTPNRSRIDFRLFFEDEQGASKDAFEIMEMEQENQEFVAGLSNDRYSY